MPASVLGATSSRASVVGAGVPASVPGAGVPASVPLGVGVSASAEGAGVSNGESERESEYSVLLPKSIQRLDTVGADVPVPAAAGDGVESAVGRGFHTQGRKWEGGVIHGDTCMPL